MFSRRQAAARPVPDRHVSGFSFALLLFGDGKNKAHTAASLFEMEHIGFCCYMFAFTCSSIMLDVGVLCPELTMYINLAMITM